MQKFEIGRNEAGQRFDKYLHKVLKEAPSSFLYRSSATNWRNVFMILITLLREQQFCQVYTIGMTSHFHSLTHEAILHTS